MIAPLRRAALVLAVAATALLTLAAPAAAHGADAPDGTDYRATISGVDPDRPPLAWESFDDPADHPLFGFRGRGPLPDLSEYGSKASQLNRFTEGHKAVAVALLLATREQLFQRPSLPRWRDAYPTVEFMLPDLLLYHQSMHIGQLSIWRRAAGLPAVKMPSTAPRPGLLDDYQQR